MFFTCQDLQLNLTLNFTVMYLKKVTSLIGACATSASPIDLKIALNFAVMRTRSISIV